MYIFWGAIAAGVVLGFLGGPVWILIPWGIMAILIGYFSKNKKSALINGAIFGFIASFLFMVRGYAGSQPVITRILPFAIIGLFGAACGLVASFLGNLFGKKR